MTHLFFRALNVLVFTATLLASASVLSAQNASAQDASSPFAIFNRVFGDADQSARDKDAQQLAQTSTTDLVVRIDRLEAQIRQLTGVIEQLQFRNQQLEAQLKRLPEAAGAQPAQQTRTPAPGNSASAAPAAPGRRSDVFDPAQNPTAPGVPQTLGTLSVNSPPPTNQGADLTETSVGAPGGRQPDTPLDLTTLGSNPANAPAAPSSNVLPAPPARNLSSTGVVASVLPPAATPKDQYDLGYGYMLRKDYALAEDALQTFLNKYPTDKLVPEAQFWLGESRFQRQRYDAAAEAFLAVSTKHATSAKAPEAMLRLGQALAALGQREMACATLAEVSRKYPRAAASVRQGVDLEQKRVRC
jgi:tol-pal system protein YbgF